MKQPKPIQEWMKPGETAKRGIFLTSSGSSPGKMGLGYTLPPENEPGIEMIFQFEQVWCYQISVMSGLFDCQNSCYILYIGSSWMPTKRNCIHEYLTCRQWTYLIRNWCLINVYMSGVLGSVQNLIRSNETPRYKPAPSEYIYLYRLWLERSNGLCMH